MGEDSETKSKNPELAAFVSAFVIGSGHIYVGKWKTGLCCLSLALSLTYSVFLLKQPFPLIPLSILWYWQMWNAYDMAEKFNEGVMLTGKKPW
jgi:hypothetical protein